MGAVYEAEHLVTRRLVALKLLHPHLAVDPEMQQRFRREATATARLSADFVAGVTDFDATPDGVPYFAMDLLSGETLSAVMKRSGPMEPNVAVPYVVQACRGVHHAYQRGLIHRDIKPRNLFVVRGDDDTTRVKILDFGIAKVLDPALSNTLTEGGRALGTPQYMAPEQALGQSDVDHRADIHALGLVLYEALTGRLPFAAKDPMAVRCQIARDKPVPIEHLRPDLPAALVAVVDQALAADPDQRFPTAAALAGALAPWANPSPHPMAWPGSDAEETRNDSSVTGERAWGYATAAARSAGRARRLTNTAASVGVGIALGLAGSALAGLCSTERAQPMRKTAGARLPKPVPAAAQPGTSAEDPSHRFPSLDRTLVPERSLQRESPGPVDASRRSSTPREQAVERPTAAPKQTQPVLASDRSERRAAQAVTGPDDTATAAASPGEGAGFELDSDSPYR